MLERDPGLDVTELHADLVPGLKSAGPPPDAVGHLGVVLDSRQRFGRGRPLHTKPPSRTSTSQDRAGGKPRPRRSPSGAGPAREPLTRVRPGDFQRQAWQTWGLPRSPGSRWLAPQAGRQIASGGGHRHDRACQRWGRVVKHAGAVGELATPDLRLLEQPTSALGAMITASTDREHSQSRSSSLLHFASAASAQGRQFCARTGFMAAGIVHQGWGAATVTVTSRLVA